MHLKRVQWLCAPQAPVQGWAKPSFVVIPLLPNSEVACNRKRNVAFADSWSCCSTTLQSVTCMLLLGSMSAYSTSHKMIAPTPHIADSRAVDALRNTKAGSSSGSSSSSTSKGLPYALTGAQERALLEIMEDLRRPVAMLRWGCVNQAVKTQRLTTM
eukprot:1158202-Pelagomonas_calceolata.AAC.1